MTATTAERLRGFAPAEISAEINRATVLQHAEDAAMLWTLRDRGTTAPNFALKDLARWDQRVEAHLDGLRVSGAYGCGLCDAAVAKGPGEAFAAAVLAFESGDGERGRALLATCAPDPVLQRGVVSAFGWIEFARVRALAERLVESSDAEQRRTGIAAYAVHREDPGPPLERALRDPSARVRARALRAAGELGRLDLVGAVERAVDEADPELCFQAARAAFLLGAVTHRVGEALTQINIRGGARAEAAFALAVRAEPPELARSWFAQLVGDPARGRLAAIAAQAIGDPALVPALIDLMHDEAAARVAGEALAAITGADLARLDLDADAPDGAGDVLGQEALLPFPSPERVAEWWREARSAFAPGQRTVLGRRFGSEALQRAIAVGSQPQRAAAALDLAILEPGRPLFEVRARGDWQSRALAPWIS